MEKKLKFVPLYPKGSLSTMSFTSPGMIYESYYPDVSESRYPESRATTRWYSPHMLLLKWNHTIYSHYRWKNGNGRHPVLILYCLHADRFRDDSPNKWCDSPGGSVFPLVHGWNGDHDHDCVCHIEVVPQNSRRPTNGFMGAKVSICTLVSIVVCMGLF